jgi:Tol biopolymer transport system component
MSWGRRGVVILVLVLAAASVAACIPRQPWSSELVSVNLAGDNGGNHRSANPAVSADGTKVVFESQASDLVADDTNSSLDVFVCDLRTGETSLVSVDTTGAATGNGPSMNAVISADGTKVAFESNATNLTSTPEPNGGLIDVYVRDLDTGVTRLAATSTAGAPSETAGSIRPEFSHDGGKLGFVGSGLHPLDTTLGMLGPDIYVRDLTTGVVELVTVNATNDGSGDGWSLDPGEFSPDGSRLAFTSPASNLVPGDINQVSDLFVRDLNARTTTLISVNAAGTMGGNGQTAYDASFSADGNLLAFTSSASDLVATDTNEASDIFVRNLAAGTTSLVSINAAGTDSARGTITGVNESSGPVFSPDGHSIAFMSYASDFGPTDSDTENDLFIDTDIYLRNLTSGTTTLVSSNADGTDSDRGRSQRPIFTADGGRIVFEGDGNPLGGEPSADDPGQLYMKDLVTGNVTLVSANADGTAGSNGSSYNASITTDGLTIVFESSASDLGPSDTNGRADIYVARLQGADLATTLAPLTTTDLGDITTLRATIENRGPHDGQGASMTLLLTPDLSFVNAETQAGSCTRPSAEHPSLVVCQVGDLPVGDTATVTVTATVAAARGQAIAHGQSEAIDPDSTNNTTTRAWGN